MMHTRQVPTLNLALREDVQNRLDAKTKPLGSLGLLEDLACRLAMIQDQAEPRLDNPCLLVFAGDHGIAQWGVSPYPQSVTSAMVRNFSQGGAAINVLTQQLGWDMVLVNSGTLEDTPFPGILDRRLGPGTASFHNGEAMDHERYEQALEIGASLVRDRQARGARLIALGEMGIGNSSAAAMLIHYLTATPLAEVVSRGAGCNDEQLQHKLALLETARKFHGDLSNPDEILRRFAGFEMVMAVGAMFEAARLRVPVVIDGLIMSSAALAAIKAQARLQDFLIFAHRSAAVGHARLLDDLGVTALFDLGMRLGEGTGAALALPLLQSSLAILERMATFASAEIAARRDS